MKLKFIHKSILFLCMALAVMLNSSCEKYDKTEKQSTFIVFSLGFNNLSSALKSDIEDMIKVNTLSKDLWKRNNLLIFSHQTQNRYDYETLTAPVLTHVYTDKKNRIIRDTVLVMDKSTISVSAEIVGEVLGYVQEHFPAKKYGMLMSSHGTGWAPENYCNRPDQYDYTGDITGWRSAARNRVIPAPLAEGRPDVKSIGVHNVTKTEIIEIDITDLAEAIPMKLDYIIFDACFMGCVEVAYELKDKCDKIAFSQTEILEDGMDYKTMLSYLFKFSGPDLKGFCENYYRYYDSRHQVYRSATISLVDCTQLDSLALVCKDIFETQRTKIASLEGSNEIQRYFRDSYAYYHGWFFDLESIIVESGASPEQLAQFYDALGKCIIYKAATPQFMTSIDILTHSGFSMYLPYRSRTYLNDFYMNLKWNESTGLVR